MTREEKIAKRKVRAKERADKHNDEYRRACSTLNNRGILGKASLGYFKKTGITSNWPDSSSPTGYSQVCDWQGFCQSPCNGDC